ncbi:hypothetical protein ACN28E_32245 [Archangium lansingense]|uniref:hypothetical protein n=1 Tax=Archangium lansingense TaxID=2995310 RepID=UPI003B7BC3E4
MSVATGEHEVNPDRTWLVDMELAKAKIGEPIKWTTGEQWGGGFDDYLLHVEPKGGVFLREVAGRVVNKHFPNNKDGSLRDYQVWGFESKGDALYARYLLRMLAEPKFITNASAQRTAELGLVETALFDHSQDGLCKDFFDVMSWLEMPQSVYDTSVANIPGKFSPADMLKESLLKYLEVTGHRLHPVAEVAFTLEELVSGIIRGERFEPIKYQGVTFIGANLSAGLYDKVSRKELLQYIWAIRQSRVEKGPDMWMGITDPLLPRVNGNVRGYCGLVREAALGPIGSGI